MCSSVICHRGASATLEPPRGGAAARASGLRCSQYRSALRCRGLRFKAALDRRSARSGDRRVDATTMRCSGHSCNYGGARSQDTCILT